MNKTGESNEEIDEIYKIFGKFVFEIFLKNLEFILERL